MTRILTVICVGSLLFVSSVFASDAKSVKHEVRDASGRLLHKTTTRGNQTEVRDPSGKLLMKSKTTPDGRTETRSPSGKLLFKSK
jgi:YD repeat-containing protein